MCLCFCPPAHCSACLVLSLRLFLSIHLCVYLAYGPDPACSPRFMKCEQLSRWCISYSGRLCVGFVPQMKAYDSCETLVAQTQHTDTEAAARAVSTQEKTEKREMRRRNKFRKRVGEERRRRRCMVYYTLERYVGYINGAQKQKLEKCVESTFYYYWYIRVCVE